LLIEDGSVVNFSDKNNLIHPTSTRRADKSQPGTLEHVFAIEEDSEGNIWFGDRDTGAWKYDGRKITNYSIVNKVSIPMIWTIYKDNQNNLLFGVANGGVFVFNGKSFERRF
jgi:ligand-binding sensor domain-containing protein